MVVVVPSPFDMVRQRRPAGPAWTVDDSWKRDVKTAMKKAGISQADLAAKIGVTPSAITVLFRPETKQTRLKPAIHKVLGMLPPTSGAAITRDDAMNRLLRVWPTLSEEQRELVLATSEALAAKPR
jgi:predicted transcriptional regulator